MAVEDIFMEEGIEIPQLNLPPPTNDILPASKLMKAAREELWQYESGEKLPFLTSYPHLNRNTYGGPTPENIYVIAGTSGTGKSFFLQRLQRDFMDKVMNPFKGRRVMLCISWEMGALTLLVRRIQQETKLLLKDIYYAPKSAEQNEIINRIVAEESSPDVYYINRALTPTELEKQLVWFFNQHKDAERILVAVDHMGLARGEDKTSTMNQLIEILNSLKVSRKYKNVMYFILSQLNRKIDERTNHQYLAPNKGDLYGADLIYQTADMVLIINRPDLFGHPKYMSFNPCVYPELEAHMKNPGNQNTYFLTENRLFYHYLKIRNTDPSMTRLDIEILGEMDSTLLTTYRDFDADRDEKEKKGELKKSNIADNYDEDDRGKDDLPF